MADDEEDDAVAEDGVEDALGAVRVGLGWGVGRCFWGGDVRCEPVGVYWLFWGMVGSVEEREGVGLTGAKMGRRTLARDMAVGGLVEFGWVGEGDGPRR